MCGEEKEKLVDQRVTVPGTLVAGQPVHHLFPLPPTSLFSISVLQYMHFGTFIPHWDTTTNSREEKSRESNGSKKKKLVKTSQTYLLTGSGRLLCDSAKQCERMPGGSKLLKLSKLSQDWVLCSRKYIKF